ncbi:hypothetical protein [Cryobacterium zhongshanensis]|uniref:Uncharacterized protein n=1 Tax=Cryobacterium zhongshanensis TaxID=2928153 RepID=A0AA41QYZ6_9MICO|nr:hypothetical protein [Cryobacterium zhongshanensis]MCI4659714.1 hypothetical protein [Cryobacterium zhongshanensis]
MFGDELHGVKWHSCQFAVRKSDANRLVKFVKFRGPVDEVLPVAGCGRDVVSDERSNASDCNGLAHIDLLF